MTTATAHVRMLAFLHTHQRALDRPTSLDIEVPANGIPAATLADQIGLPAELVEGLFHNNRNSDLTALVKPGDRVAFVPPGTPASHPAFFGKFTTRP